MPHCILCVVRIHRGFARRKKPFFSLSQAGSKSPPPPPHSRPSKSALRILLWREKAHAPLPKKKTNLVFPEKIKFRKKKMSSSPPPIGDLNLPGNLPNSKVSFLPTHSNPTRVISPPLEPLLTPGRRRRKREETFFFPRKKKKNERQPQQLSPSSPPFLSPSQITAKL